MNRWQTYVLTRTCPVCGRSFVPSDFDPKYPGHKPVAFRAGVIHEGCLADEVRDRQRDLTLDDDGPQSLELDHDA